MELCVKLYFFEKPVVLSVSVMSSEALCLSAKKQPWITAAELQTSLSKQSFHCPISLP